jgi:hypothetical protein
MSMAPERPDNLDLEILDYSLGDNRMMHEVTGESDLKEPILSITSQRGTEGTFAAELYHNGLATFEPLNQEERNLVGTEAGRLIGAYGGEDVQSYAKSLADFMLDQGADEYHSSLMHGHQVGPKVRTRMNLNYSGEENSATWDDAENDTPLPMTGGSKAPIEVYQTRHAGLLTVREAVDTILEAHPTGDLGSVKVDPVYPEQTDVQY